MEIKYATDILKALADGINPITGEVLPPEDSCNQPDVIRALHCVLETIKKPKKRNLENAGTKWTNEEKDSLISEFESGMSISEIAKKHKRSHLAIETKLSELGKIDSAFVALKRASK